MQMFQRSSAAREGARALRLPPSFFRRVSVRAQTHTASCNLLLHCLFSPSLLPPSLHFNVAKLQNTRRASPSSLQHSVDRGEQSSFWSLPKIQGVFSRDAIAASRAGGFLTGLPGCFSRSKITNLAFFNRLDSNFLRMY